MTRARDLSRLDPFAASDRLHMIVESPRGARIKYEYEPARDVFTAHRPLPAGLAYPFDWGFIPGTLAPDGDPVDACLVSDDASYPGVLVVARPIAALDVQEQKDGKQSSNPRIVLVPEWRDPSVWEGVLRAVRDDIASFLAKVGEGAGKTIVRTEWRSAAHALRYVEERRARRAE